MSLVLEIVAPLLVFGNPHLMAKVIGVSMFLVRTRQEETQMN